MNTDGESAEATAKTKAKATPKAKAPAIENPGETGGTSIFVASPETAVSPGQACVFYCKDAIGTRLLGGGWIHSTNE